MKIKRLEIVGFKSFVDKVALDFPHGITAIVGPNGCGKSNIVDAIRWVMGEQSAKNLRGKSMGDVIFGGCDSRKSLGMAEVSLIFSTEDKRIPARYLEYSEIQVTRRLYRDGESEYLLNRTPCRLMDVAELFMDTGVGARAYSIIEQGRIGMILLSKPEERRFLIEEAAGVTKFKSRKLVAIRKIEVSRQNLLRIGDIISELKRQLNALQRQAKKAERFREYREELKEIEILSAAARYSELEAERNRVTHELASLESRALTVSEGVETGELALEEKKIALLEEEKLLSLAQEDLYRGKGEIQAAENRLEFQRKELLGLARQKERLSEELSNIQRQLVDASTEMATLVDRKGRYILELAGVEESLSDGEKKLEELTGAERDLMHSLEDNRKQLFAAVSEIAHLNNQEAGAAKRLTAIAEILERNSRERTVLQEKLARLGDSTSSVRLLTESLSVLKTELTEELGVTRSREADRRAALDIVELELVSLRDNLSKCRSRLHSLEELEAQFAGYGQGVRSLLLAERFKDSFCGMVADIVETDEVYELALEAVLGEKLQYVISPDADAALAAVDFLKETSGGRCSLATKGLPSGPFRGGPAGAESLLSKIIIRDGLEDLVALLVADTYIAVSLEAALRHARENPELTFVTLQGEVVSSGGIMTGGSTEGVRQGLVHKKREMKQLGLEVAALSANVQAKEREREALKEEIAVMGDNLRISRQKLHDTEIDLVNCGKDLQRGIDESREIGERLTLKEMEDSQLCEEKRGLQVELERAGEKKTAGEGSKRGHEAEIAALQELLVSKKREIEESRELLTTMKVTAAGLREKRDSNVRGIGRVEQLEGDLRVRLTGHSSELERCDQEEVVLVAAVAGNEGSLQQLLKLQFEAEASFQAVKAQYESDASVVQEEEARLKKARAGAEEIRLSMNEKKLQQSELEMKLSNTRNSLLERYRLDIVSLLPEYSDRTYGVSQSLARQAELQRLIDEIGEVNLTAIEEYRELEERFTFLSAQKADLEESLHSLQKAIQRINKTTRKRFLETFHQVNEKFQEVFPRLFCGGRAELKLTDEEDLLESGIDIIVQPPGKKLQNVTLLSGGEKALTAVALIFSIFLIKPSPFCLLDEVDAPLDDANIGRFNEMVREMTAFSQFLIITHNKATMAVADTLFGVTMEEPGVSKLVSVRLN